MSSPDQNKEEEREMDSCLKDKIICLFLDGLEPTQMFRQLVQEGVTIKKSDVNNIVYDYLGSLPESIDNIDCSKISKAQRDNLKSVIEEKSRIDGKIVKFETMKQDVSKLKSEMSKLYPEQLYVNELNLVSNAVQYALDAGVPKYLIKKRINKISSNGWHSSINKINGCKLRRLPGVY